MPGADRAERAVAGLENAEEGGDEALRAEADDERVQ